MSVEDVRLSEGLLRSVERCVLREDVSAGRGMSVESDYLRRMASLLDASGGASAEEMCLLGSGCL